MAFVQFGPLFKDGIIFLGMISFRKKGTKCFGLITVGHLLSLSLLSVSFGRVCSGTMEMKSKLTFEYFALCFAGRCMSD